MPALTYRPATLADLAALLQLEAGFPGDRLSRRSFRHLLTRAHAEVWVCVERKAVIANAVVLYRAETKSARLYSIVVARAARGRGIAKKLVEAIETAASRRGCDRLYLEVRTDNRAAKRLYEKLGYRLVRRIPRFYDDGQDALRLERMLPRRHAPRHLAA